MRIVKGPCLIDIGPNPSPRASRKASTLNLIKPQRHKVYRERLRLFMRKRGEVSIKKRK